MNGNQAVPFSCSRYSRASKGIACRIRSPSRALMAGVMMPLISIVSRVIQIQPLFPLRRRRITSCQMSRDVVSCWSFIAFPP